MTDPTKASTAEAVAWLEEPYPDDFRLSRAEWANNGAFPVYRSPPADADEIERLRGDVLHDLSLGALLNEAALANRQLAHALEAAEARAASAEAETARIKIAALTHIDEMAEIQRKLFVAEAERDALKAKLATAVVALEPFDDFAQWVDAEGWTSNVHREGISVWFGPTDFRRAREACALANAEPQEAGR